MHLPDGLTAEQVKRLRRVADTCPVRRSLEAGFVFDERVCADVAAEGAAQHPLDARSAQPGARRTPTSVLAGSV